MQEHGLMCVQERRLTVVSDFSSLNFFSTIYCRVVKLADTPPCLGGGDYGKLASANQPLLEGSTPSPTAPFV